MKRTVVITIFSISFCFILIYLIYNQVCGGAQKISPECRRILSPIVRFVPDKVIPTPKPIIIEPPTNVQDENLAEIPDLDNIELPPNSQGGVMGFVGQRSNQVTDDNSLFFVDNNSSFIGEYFLLPSYNSNKKPQLIFSCFIDFVQFPCSPSNSLKQFYEVTNAETLIIPIQTPNLNQGLHDLAVLFWENYNEGYNGALSLINNGIDAQFMVHGLRSSLAVGGNTTPPKIEFPSLSSNHPQSPFGVDGLIVSDREDILDEVGAVQYFVYAKVQKGDPLNLFLHLNNTKSTGIDFAISAFIDYYQVPITWKEASLTPLYTHVKANAWETAFIQIPTPAQIGHYKVQFISFMLPYARLDLAGSKYYGQYLDYPLPVFYFASTEIYLDVYE